MNKMDEILTQVIDEIHTEDKNIQVNYNQKLTTEDIMAIESIKSVENPFIMIDVEAVMKDLNICKTIAYRLFQREDFPSINIGKNYQIMLLPYMIWKMQKRK